MRILLVSQMYPGTRAPDFGTFVADLEGALAGRGHEIARAVVDHRGGRSRQLALARDIVATARRFRPEVVYAHFLVPAGFLAAIATRTPIVVTAHGQDVENAVRNAAIRRATGYVGRRSAAVIAVSEWLRQRLERTVASTRGKTHVIDCGVDVARFAPRPQAEARIRTAWEPEGTAFLCLGSLTERKNVLRLAHAYERRGEGSLAFVGDGPLRGALEGRRGIRLVGPVAHDRVADWIASADVVCQPSLVEPFGLAALEAMAAGVPIVATRVGGPPEFVTPDAGVLVDPEDDDALLEALGRAAALRRPNTAGIEAAARHALDVQAARIETVLARAADSS